MEKENKEMEALNKSIDALLKDTFPKLEKGDASKIVADAETTADAAIAKSPSSKDDASRGAGRPKQISDVPKKDQDGARAKQYDGDITENEGKEEENEEAKKQAQAIDQSSSKGHTEKSPKAPKMRPFMKSYELFQEFQDFKKSQIAGNVEVQVLTEEMVSLPKSEFEELSKSVKTQGDIVSPETESLLKSVRDLVTVNTEQAAILKAIVNKPMPSKSITDVHAVEKALSPSQSVESFSKAEVADAAFDLAKAGKIPSDAVTELEMTGGISDPSLRRMVEAHLQQG